MPWTSDDKFQLVLEDETIAEIPIVALGPLILRAARIAERLMRQGRSKRVAWRLALIATSGSVPPSAWTLLHPLAPDLFRTPRYTKAEKRAVLARLIRQHGIRRADAAAMFDRAFVDRLFRRARRAARSTATSSDAEPGVPEAGVGELRVLGGAPVYGIAVDRPARAEEQVTTCGAEACA